MAAQLQAPPQGTGSKQDQAVAAGAVVLLGAVTISAAASQLAAPFAAIGIGAAALRSALAVVLSLPPDRLGALGPATLTTLRMNALRRAQYLVAAAQRIQAALVEAQSTGESIGDAIDSAVSAERRYYGQHLIAGWNRMMAASKTDTAVRDHGLLLGWQAVNDRRTSAECRAASGCNFRADAIPLIGYPGSVHPHCRCFPVRPFRGARLLPSAVLLERAA